MSKNNCTVSSYNITYLLELGREPVSDKDTIET